MSRLPFIFECVASGIPMEVMCSMSSATTFESQQDRKLGELILYIAKQSEGDEPIGATKLNSKVAYFESN